jgi:hypothetical protein
MADLGYMHEKGRGGLPKNEAQAGELASPPIALPRLPIDYERNGTEA